MNFLRDSGPFRSVPAVLAAALSGFLLLAGTAKGTSSATSAPRTVEPHAAQFTATLSYSPAYAGDAGDPDVLESAGTYYAFTTGTALGNNLQALVDTTGSPESGWRSYTGKTYGSTALPNPPGWEAVNTQTSPGVFNYDNQFVMFYDAAQAGHASDSGFDCLSVATAPSISPTNAAFTDSSSGPLLCQANLGGAIDPAPYIDPATGIPWLVWKSNDGGSSQPARIWTEELNGSGTGFLAGTSPAQIFSNNTVAYPWESTVEDPSILPEGGSYYLLFAAGIYTSSNYAEGYAVCSAPTGPCTQTDPEPIVSSYGTVSGPGGGSWFQDSSGNYWLDYAAWTQGCTSYSCGGARELFVAPITFGAGGGAAGSGGINKPAVGVAYTPDDGGYWIDASDGGIFSEGDAAFHGSAGDIALNKPVVGMAATSGGGGYWLVASDGGIFTYGDAAFHGSAGYMALNQPIVGMAATPDGGGYWLVASDGGIFTYGDAAFEGSAGNIALNKPIIGMARTNNGQGYILVASDGGIFSYGNAVFEGSPA